MRRAFAFSDEAKIGVPKFANLRSKIGFFHYAHTVDTNLKNGKSVWFRNNLTLEERSIEKQLGVMRCKLHEIEKINLGDTDINRKKKNSVHKI